MKSDKKIIKILATKEKILTEKELRELKQERAEHRNKISHLNAMIKVQQSKLNELEEYFND